MPNLTINGGGIISNSKNLPNLDLRYGPYDSLTDAYNSLIDYLVPGLVIGVFKEGGKVVEYQAQRVDGKIELLLKESDEIITNYDVLENHPKINNIELKGNKTNEQLGIPTKTSDLINDSGFSTSQQLNEKQDNLVSGVNIKTINDQSILGSGNIVVEGETDYTNLSNKPTINGHSLSGNLTAKDLGIINRVCLNDGTEIEPDEVGDVKLPIIPTSTSIIESGSNAVPTEK